MRMGTPTIAYLSFDIVPAPKGAAVHIAAFVRFLAAAIGPVALVTVAAPGGTGTVAWPGVHHVPLPATGATLIHRVMEFRRHLRHWLAGQRFGVIHVRSIYEGFPIAVEKAKWCDRLIFEVNGLPSIELKYRYPDVAADADLLNKLTAQEQVCLEAADVIVTPSPVTRQHLISRHIAPEKIHVIPNGVDLEVFTYQPASIWQRAHGAIAPFKILYFGTLSSWQGADLAIRAVARVQPQLPAALTLIGPASKGQTQALHKLAAKLGVSDRVRLAPPTPQAALVAALHQSHCIIAPLTLCDRNWVQGCCPLKVLEGMASGTPVIASDLPVVNALGEPNQHFLSVKPSSVTALADAWLELQASPALAQQLSQAGRHQIEQHFTWPQAGAALVALYRDLVMT